MSYMLLIVITMVIGFATQGFINSSYKKYSTVSNQLGMTGAQVARRMLDSYGLYDVPVQRIAGTLTDHYDPRTRVVRLSEGIYDSPSISGMAVACHECGHAVQHAQGYLPMRLRSALVPVANFGSSAWLIILFVGIMLNWLELMYLGIIFYAFAVAFQLVTLPVEFNASHRGLNYIGDTLMVGGSAKGGARTVLTAAALTYVAAALTSVMQLLYFLNIVNDR